jgi:hypothetical protein
MLSSSRAAWRSHGPTVNDDEGEEGRDWSDTNNARTSTVGTEQTRTSTKKNNGENE